MSQIRKIPPTELFCDFLHASLNSATGCFPDAFMGSFLILQLPTIV